MDRISRRSYGDDFLKLINSGGLHHLIDNTMKIAYRISDEEYDILCEKCTDLELSDLMDSDSNFSLNRRKIMILKKYL